MTTTTKPSNVRLTPGWLVECARDALGGIDIDPCTEDDNPCGAEVFYTVRRPPPPGPFPPGNLWVNPPWSRGEIERWARRVFERPAGSGGALFMTPTDPRTPWFRYLAGAASHLIVPMRQIRCWAPELERYVEPSRGCYLWANSEVDLDVFREDGTFLVLEL